MDGRTDGRLVFITCMGLDCNEGDDPNERNKENGGTWKTKDGRKKGKRKRKQKKI